QTTRMSRGRRGLIADAPLMSRWNLHVLTVFCHGAPGHIDTLALEQGRDLLIRERPRAVFLFDHLLDPPLEQQQGSCASGGSLYSFRKEVPELEDALGRVDILVSHGAAHGRWMNANLFGHFFDHHGFQMIDAVGQKVGLAPDNGLADLENGLLPLLNI